MTNSAFKIVVLGRSGTGKTSLLSRYATNKFPDPNEYIPVVLDNCLITQTMDEGDQEIDGNYDLSLWDTAGSEQQDRLRPLNYPQTNVFLLCFPVDGRNMFEDIRSYWKPEIQHYMPKTPFIVVAMKADLRTESKKSETAESTAEKDPIERYLIFKEEGQKEAELLGAADYVECSSLLNEGISNVFKAAIKAAVRYPPNESKKKCSLL